MSSLAIAVRAEQLHTVIASGVVRLIQDHVIRLSKQTQSKSVTPHRRYQL